jgi:Branched-chain amino acid ATP-binding cassette transporter
LEFGQKIADGPADEVRTDPRAVAAYLGQGDHPPAPPSEESVLPIGDR